MANEKAAAAKPSAPKGQKKSVVKYFKDARSEFKKVVWPSKKTVFNNTVVVLITLIVSGVFVWGIDTLFATLLRLALGLSVSA